MRVAQQLHLDMAGAQDHLLQIALAIAEGGLGLAATLADLLDQLGLAVDRAHAAPATAPGRLQHQRIADLRRLTLDGVEILAQHLGRGDHRHARLDRHAPRAGLVAKRAHRVGARTDEGDAGRRAGIDEIGVFRQQAVSRMDRVGARQLGHADDLGDGQIGRDRPQPLADAIGLVRLEAVQAQLVLLGIDGDRLLAQLVGRAHHANGNLAPVRHQNLLEHAKPPSSLPSILSVLRCSASVSDNQKPPPRDLRPKADSRRSRCHGAAAMFRLRSQMELAFRPSVPI